MIHCHIHVEEFLFIRKVRKCCRQRTTHVRFCMAVNIRGTHRAVIFPIPYSFVNIVSSIWYGTPVSFTISLMATRRCCISISRILLMVSFVLTVLDRPPPCSYSHDVFLQVNSLHHLFTISYDTASSVNVCDILLWISVGVIPFFCGYLIMAFCSTCSVCLLSHHPYSFANLQ